MIVEITGTFHNHIHFNKLIELKLICINIAMQLYDSVFMIDKWPMFFLNDFLNTCFQGPK